MLYEKYRPGDWHEVAGQEKAVKTLLRLRDTSGLAGRAYFISGKSGQGKSTIGRLIAKEVADPFYTEILDAGDINTAAMDRITRTMHLYGAGSRTGRAFIIEEAHGLKKASVRSLLVLLEQIPRHVVFVFTTTIDGLTMFEDSNMDASPLLSRCICIALAQRDVARAFAERAKWIAEKENLDGQPIEKYIRLVNNKGGNMRAVLQEIEAGAMLA